jgi:hypothetical protein
MIKNLQKGFFSILTIPLNSLAGKWDLIGNALDSSSNALN